MKNINLTRLTISIILMSFYSFSSLAAEVHGILRVVKGDVKIVSSDGKSKKAKIGLKVFPSEKIITAADSRAKVVMVDNNEINVSPSSEVVIQRYEFNPDENKKDVLLNVIYGKVRSKVNQKYDGANNKFRVQTPSAVAGVRGTDFFTSYNQNTKTSSVVTFEGEVMYGMPGKDGGIKNPVSVRAGQMASNAPGKSPDAPKPVPKSELANLDKDSDAEKSEPSKNEKRQPADDNQKEDSKEDKKDEKDKEKKDNKEEKREDQANNEEKNNKKEEPKNKEAEPKGAAANGGNGPKASPGAVVSGGVAPAADGASIPGGGPDGMGMPGDKTGTDRGPAAVNNPPMPGGGPMMPPPGGNFGMPGGGNMLVTGDLVGGPTGGYFPDGGFLGNDFPDFNSINTDASSTITNNLNPCIGTCNDIIRDVIEGGNTRVIIQLINGN
jgi:hypothetical protein